VAVFGWERSKNLTASKEAPSIIGGCFDASELISLIDALVARYLDRVDRGTLVYPACKRRLTDSEGDVRSIWEHTRLEAVRYVTLVPARQAGLLVEPARQLTLVDTFLRKQPHENIVVEFTGVPADDLVVAVIAGLNWLNHCSILAGVDHNKFSGTLRNFRKLAAIAQRWWSMEGAEDRCAEMLQAGEKPPLMLHLIWENYTTLAKEVASATVFGPSIEKTVRRRRKMLEEEFAERPAELGAVIAELEGTIARFEAAREPRDLFG
jgi:hypothetical protein